MYNRLFYGRTRAEIARLVKMIVIKPWRNPRKSLSLAPPTIPH